MSFHSTGWFLPAKFEAIIMFMSALTCSSLIAAASGDPIRGRSTHMHLEIHICSMYIFTRDHLIYIYIRVYIYIYIYM